MIVPMNSIKGGQNTVFQTFDNQAKMRPVSNTSYL